MAFKNPRAPTKVLFDETNYILLRFNSPFVAMIEPFLPLALVLVAAVLCDCAANSIRVGTQGQLEAALAQAGSKVVLVAIEGPWNGHLRQLEPKLEQIAQKARGDLVLIKMAKPQGEYLTGTNVASFVLMRGGRIVDEPDEVHLVSAINKQLPRNAPSLQEIDLKQASSEQAASERVLRVESLKVFKNKMEEAGNRLILAAFTCEYDLERRYIDSILEQIAQTYEDQLMVLEVSVEEGQIARYCLVDYRAEWNRLKSFGRKRTFVLIRDGIFVSFVYGSMKGDKFVAKIKGQLHKAIKEQLKPRQGIQGALKKWFAGWGKQDERARAPAPKNM